MGSWSLGSVPEDGDSQHFLQSDSFAIPETLRASWSLELLPWCRERNNFSYNWEKLGKLVWLRQVCAGEAQGQAEPVSLFFAPCRQLCPSAWAAV